MLIEIRKAGFVNKGAELMLHATLQKMREAYPDAQFVMTPNSSAPYEKRTELGFLQKAWLWRYSLQWGDLAMIAPKKLREMYGIVLDKEIDIVIDAAGFLYGDHAGDGNSQELADSCKRWKKNGTKIILLPQAFGPFTSPKIKEAIKTVADNADLIFARDPISYEYLTGVAGERQTIKIAPDFTNLLEGVLPSDFDVEKNRFCIVPNYQMIAKTAKDQSKTYVPFMIKCTQYLLEKDQKPFVLIHEGANDLMIAQKISEAVGGNLPVVLEPHPLKIRGILGACEGSIGSRFHGLVSALSQNVPALATGWSHKYKMLFEDYGFSEGLMDVMADEKEIKKKIDLIINLESKKVIQKTIEANSKKLKDMSEKMWKDVLCLVQHLPVK